MTTADILTSLRCCAAINGYGCGECPVRALSGTEMRPCSDAPKIAAADLIEQLTDRCARYAEEIAVLQEKTRWIPVEERLPEISRSLGGASDIVLGLISNPAGYPPPNPGLCVYTEDGEWMCRGLAVTVTHWMPLPDGSEVE